MVGYLHATEGSPLKGADNPTEAVDCSARGAGGSSAPAAGGAAGSSVKSVVCSPDLAVFPAQPDRLYQCALCRKTFAQKNTYQNHLRSHAITPGSSSTATVSAPSPPAAGDVTTTAPGTGEDPYPCTICGKTFAVPARLTRHFRTHTGEKPYTCEYCHKSFSVKENLSVHRRIHTKERPYKCDVCARAFEHSGKLHRHMRIHTGERPHRCGVCGKTFIQSGQLVIHTRTHTGEKPYVCNVCRKGFTCSKQLKVHSRTHTGEKPYSCDICGKAFGYNHVLKLHQVAHFGEKVYKCTLCHTTFNSKKSMEAHIKTHSSSSTSAGSSSQVNTSSILPMNSSPPQELSDKENKDAPGGPSTAPSRYYMYEPTAPSATPTINPALLAAVAAVSKDEEESRSSSATPPLRVDEDAPLPVLEPAVRLCPDPLASLPRHPIIEFGERDSSPDYLRGSPPAPSAQYVMVEAIPRRRSGKSGHATLLTPPSSNPVSPSPSSSPDLADRGANAAAQEGVGGPKKRSRMILQRYLLESTPPPALRSSSVIRFAQRSHQ